MKWSLELWKRQLIRVIFDFIRTHKKYTSENRNAIMNSGNIKPIKEKSELNGKNQNSNSDNELKGKNYIIEIYTKKLKNGFSQYSFIIRK